MRAPLPPWVDGPLELLIHAEGHLRDGDDFDRRIALISFDNAIEVAVATYLTLHPIQRGNRSYSNSDVGAWVRDYHSKLDFVESELGRRSLKWEVERSHIVWVHDCRNEQYHGGRKGTPEKRVLETARKAALWIFGLLFEVGDVEDALEHALLSRMPPAPPSRVRAFDLAIDGSYGIVQVGEGDYYASELLFAIDSVAYGEIGRKLCNPTVLREREMKEPG